MHGENTIVDPRVKTRPEGHSLGIEKKKKKHIRKSYPNLQSYTLTTMTSVSVRFEEMTASHRFELQSESKDDHQQ